MDAVTLETGTIVGVIISVDGVTAIVAVVAPFVDVSLVAVVVVVVVVVVAFTVEILVVSVLVGTDETVVAFPNNQIGLVENKSDGATVCNPSGTNGFNVVQETVLIDTA